MVCTLFRVYCLSSIRQQSQGITENNRIFFSEVERFLKSESNGISYEEVPISQLAILFVCSSRRGGVVETAAAMIIPGQNTDEYQKTTHQYFGCWYLYRTP